MEKQQQQTQQQQFLQNAIDLRFATSIPGVQLYQMLRENIFRKFEND